MYAYIFMKAKEAFLGEKKSQVRTEDKRGYERDECVPSMVGSNHPLISGSCMFGSVGISA